jgi:hypothetical protein
LSGYGSFSGGAAKWNCLTGEGAFGVNLMSTVANDTVTIKWGLLAGWHSRGPLHVCLSKTGFESMAVGARRLFIGCVLQLGLVAAVAPWWGASAQKLVDPNAVAPEYREAAEKRRAEQLALHQCSRKADEAKVLRRDRVTFINECLDKHK